jgi:hypothetical protein
VLAVVSLCLLGKHRGCKARGSLHFLYFKLNCWLKKKKTVDLTYNHNPTIVIHNLSIQNGRTPLFFVSFFFTLSLPMSQLSDI